MRRSNSPTAPPRRSTSRSRPRADPRQYIQLIEEKNRILKRLNSKPEDSSLQEREQGFSVFFRGANNDKKPTHSRGRRRRSSLQARNRRTWGKQNPKPVAADVQGTYADDSSSTSHPVVPPRLTSFLQRDRERMRQQEALDTSDEVGGDDGLVGPGQQLHRSGLRARASTSPSNRATTDNKPPRRNWLRRSVQIRTEDGDLVHASPSEPVEWTSALNVTLDRSQRLSAASPDVHDDVDDSVLFDCGSTHSSVVDFLQPGPHADTDTGLLGRAPNLALSRPTSAGALRTETPTRSHEDLKPPSPTVSPRNQPQPGRSQSRTTNRLGRSVRESVSDQLLARIASRVSRLDRRKRKYLMDVLSKLEQGDGDAVPARVWDSLQLTPSAVHNTRPTKPTSHQSTREAQHSEPEQPLSPRLQGPSPDSNWQTGALLKSHSPRGESDKSPKRFFPSPRVADGSPASLSVPDAVSPSHSASDSQSRSRSRSRSPSQSPRNALSSTMACVKLTISGTHSPARLLVIQAVELYNTSWHKLKLPPSMVDLHVGGTPLPRPTTLARLVTVSKKPGHEFVASWSRQDSFSITLNVALKDRALSALLPSLSGEANRKRTQLSSPENRQPAYLVLHACSDESLRDKGVKDLSVSVDDEVIWSGTVSLHSAVCVIDLLHGTSLALDSLPTHLASTFGASSSVTPSISSLNNSPFGSLPRKGALGTQHRRPHSSRRPARRLPMKVEIRPPSEAARPMSSSSRITPMNPPRPASARGPIFNGPAPNEALTEAPAVAPLRGLGRRRPMSASIRTGPGLQAGEAQAPTRAAPASAPVPDDGAADLQKSWDTLEMFKRLQRGRIGPAGEQPTVARPDIALSAPSSGEDLPLMTLVKSESFDLRPADPTFSGARPPAEQQPEVREALLTNDAELDALLEDTEGSDGWSDSAGHTQGSADAEHADGADEDVVAADLPEERSSVRNPSDVSDHISLPSHDGIFKYGSADSLDHAQSEAELDRALEDALTNAPDLTEDASAAGDDSYVARHPAGRVLRITIHSNWGDPHYVGLSGIELFDMSARPLSVSDPRKQVRSTARDAAEEMDADADVWRVANVVDGVNCTCDDLHLWLAPTPPPDSGPVQVFITLDEPAQLSMIRVWNYNHSRAHSARGVRRISMHLDNQLIFRGEVRQAAGSLPTAGRLAEAILFTDSAKLVQLLSKLLPHVPQQSISRKRDLEVLETELQRMSLEWAVLRERRRPPTAGSPARPSARARPVITAPEPSQSAPLPSGRCLQLIVHSSWGDARYVGLTSLAVLDETGRPIPIDPSCISAEPQDLNDIPGSSGDPRTLDKLVDGTDVTCDPCHMWLAPLRPGSQWMEIDLGAHRTISALQFWNYNKSPEDTQRGIRLATTTLDGHQLRPVHDDVSAEVKQTLDSCMMCIARAPGHTLYDFQQTIKVTQASTAGTENTGKHGAQQLNLIQNHGLRSLHQRKQRLPRHSMHVVPILPRGCNITIRLLSTWGDVHYIGLNGLAVFNECGQKVPLEVGRNVCVIPAGLSALGVESMAYDVRTPDKLFDGVDDTYEDTHMWLAPFQARDHMLSSSTPSMATPVTNSIFITLDYPVCLSKIMVWNYSKSPHRGVKHLQVLLDGYLIHNGFMRPAPPEPTNKTAKHRSFGQTISFEKATRAVTASDHVGMPTKQHVDFYNDETATVKSRVQPVPGRRPMTSSGP